MTDILSAGSNLNIKGRKTVPIVELDINKNDKRTIDGFVVKGYEKVPKRFIKNLEKEFKGKNYDKNLIAINKNFQSHPFVTLERQPQTLFTKDSTNIYLFLKRKRPILLTGSSVLEMTKLISLP
jgi:hypothetical protein